MYRVATLLLIIFLAACSSTQPSQNNELASPDTWAVTCSGDIAFHQTPVVAKSNPMGLIGTGTMDCGRNGLMRVNAIVREHNTMSIVSPCHVSLEMSPGDLNSSANATAFLRGSGQATAVCADKVRAEGDVTTLGYWGLFDPTNAKGSGYVMMKNEAAEVFVFFFNLNAV